MKLNKYLSGILRESTPFAILEESLQKFFTSLDKIESFETKAFMDEMFDDSEKVEQLFEIKDGVAIIQIKGAIFNEANCATAFGMGVANSDLQAALQLAAEDESVTGILLDVNSPGGEVAGTNETANLVEFYSKIKPITAFVGDLAASAAYWIASQADNIIIAETASVGSIGVRAVYKDNSQQLKNEGIKQYSFLSSQSPDKDFDPTKKAHIETLQGQLDYLAGIFIDAVSKGRRTSSQNVTENFGKGGIIYGREAVARGMADNVGTFSDALNTLRSKKLNNGERQSMKIEQIAENTNTPQAIDADALRKEAISAERERITGLSDLLAQTDEEKAIVKKAIDKGASVADTALALNLFRKESEKIKNAALAAKREEDAAQIPAIKSDEKMDANSEEAQIRSLAAGITAMNSKQGVMK